MEPLYTRIGELTDHAQQLVDELHARSPADETFAQVGILDATKLVFDYLRYGELGCAIQHLLYVVHESNIAFAQSKVRELHEIAATVGEPNHYSEESLAAKPPPPGATVFNRLISEGTECPTPRTSLCVTPT